MKKSIIMSAIVLAGITMTGCDDFLNDNRFPESVQTSNPAYWSNPSNVLGQCNYFYETFSGYGNAGSGGEFYFPALNDNQTSGSGGNQLAPWKNINVPTASSSWNDPYTHIRRANLIIEGVKGSTLPESDKVNFTAIARLVRGFQYYNLVRCYGDVPLIEEALLPSDREDLFGPRVNREKVMDYALEDLTFAVANISTQKSKNAFSKDLAAAMKSEVCLYEASYARYHKQDEERAKKFYNEVVACSEPLVKAYPIGDNYQALYNSFRSALSVNDEVIFLKEYEKDVFMHATCDYTSSSTPISGITKDAFDAYLFKDGKPLALTTEVKNDAGTLNPDSTINISALLAVRDGRLAQTIDDVVYFTGRTYKRPNSMPMTSVTGYGVKKYVNPEMTYEYTTTIWNYTCAPLYWGALVGLNYAEAKAELGSLNDDDLAITINKLFERAGLPAVTVAGLSSMNDPANNMKVGSLIWEIRRCRRCELIYDKDLRYWDLVRWHQLELLDSSKYPNVALGANVSALPADKRPASKGDYIDASGKQTRTFSEREYLFPIPSGQIALNNALTQNNGWK